MLIPNDVINATIATEKLELFSLIDNPSKEAMATRLINLIYNKAHLDGQKHCLKDLMEKWRSECSTSVK